MMKHRQFVPNIKEQFNAFNSYGERVVYYTVSRNAYNFNEDLYYKLIRELDTDAASLTLLGAILDQLQSEEFYYEEA